MTQFFEHAAVLALVRLVPLAALYFFVLAVTNVVWMRLSCRSPRASSTAMVSVLIPARNEERNIGRCLDSLLAQTHANYEIIVLDDQSTDGTWSIIERCAREHPGRVTAIRGKPLPENGWHGKPHALHQLAELAKGEYLLFTDADTVHAPESISWAVTNLESHRVDFLSAYTGQEFGTIGEALLVPMMYLMTAVVMPIWMVTVPRAALFSFAIGQFVMIRREDLPSGRRVRGDFPSDQRRHRNGTARAPGGLPLHLPGRTAAGALPHVQGIPRVVRRHDPEHRGFLQSPPRVPGIRLGRHRAAVPSPLCISCYPVT